MYIKLSTDFVCPARVLPAVIVCLSIIDNTNLSTDIECNSAAAINNIALDGEGGGGRGAGDAELSLQCSCSNPLYQVDELLWLIS